MLTLLFTLSQLTFAFTSEVKEFDANSIRKVEVENSSGLVKITTISGSLASVMSQKVKFSDQCRMSIASEGTTLRAKVETSGDMTSSDCEVNLTLNVPKAVEVEIKNGSGGIEVLGTEGAITYRIGSGSVKIDAIVKGLEGRSGSGDANIKGLTGNANVETGAGDVNLAYAIDPQIGALDIRSGSGNANVILPSTAKILTSTVLGSGSTFNELGNSTDAKFKVTFRSGSGDLRIKAQ